MTCWKWFDGILKEAKIEVTERNKYRIDKTIYRFIGEQSLRKLLSTLVQNSKRD
jgi:hypothetical protein